MVPAAARAPRHGASAPSAPEVPWRAPEFVAYRRAQAERRAAARDTPSLWGVVRAARPDAAAVRRFASGAATAVASSAVAAATVTRPLLALPGHLAAHPPPAAALVARWLAAGVGALSPSAAFAAWGTGLVVVGAMLAVADRPQSVGGRLAVGAVYVGIGLLVSPFWLLSGPQLLQAAPLLLLSAVGTLAVHYVLQRLQERGRMGLLLHLFGAGALVAFAPLAGATALGTPVAESLKGAVGVLAGTCFAGSAALWTGYRGNTDDRETALVRSCRVPVNPARRLARPGEAAPEVFVQDADFAAAVRALLANGAAGHPQGATFLLHGPPGTGKTVTVQALANLGPWPLYAPTLDLFYDAPSPAAVVTQLFDEARRLARRSGQTQVLFFDEGDVLFADTERWRELGSQAAQRPLALTETFNYELDGNKARLNQRLVVVVATNHPERMDRAVFERFSRCATLGATVAFAPPSAEDLGYILQRNLVHLHRDYAGLRALAPLALAPEELAAWVAPLHQSGATGRHLVAAVARTLCLANAHFGTAEGAADDQVAFDAFVRPRLRQALIEAERTASHD